MSDLDSKLAHQNTSSDEKARARYKKHLAWKGHVVLSNDKLGPIEIMVGGGSQLETWRRESRADGDCNMVLVDAKPWRYDA